MGSFDFLPGEGKASFPVLLKSVLVVLKTAIPQNPACDVMVKGSVKGQGKRCLFKWRASCAEVFSITGAIFQGRN